MFFICLQYKADNLLNLTRFNQLNRFKKNNSIIHMISGMWNEQIYSEIISDKLETKIGNFISPLL